MSRKPTVRKSRVRTISSPAIHDLKALSEEPGIMSQFMVDVLVASEKHVHRELNNHPLQAIKDDALVQRRPRAMVQMITTANVSARTEGAEKEAHRRLEDLQHEYGFLAINLALTQCSRAAVTAVIHPGYGRDDEIKIEHLEQVYEMTNKLLSSLPQMYCNHEHIPLPNHRDLNNFGTLVEWIETMILGFLRQSQETFQGVYVGEQRQQEKIPAAIQVLINLYNAARELFARLFPKIHPLALTTGDTTRESFRIAHEKLKQLETTIAVLQVKLLHHPSLPLIGHIQDIIDLSKK